MSEQHVAIELRDLDCHQLLSGLDVLIEQWKATANYLRTGEVDSEVCIRKSHSEHEATSIAESYIAIRDDIRYQIKRQTG